MQTAQTYLEVVRRRGERRLELRRVYHNLKNRELFLLAYGKLYANKGALTPGTDLQDTADAMSLKRIDDLIAALEQGTYQWKPVRRLHIPKKNGKTRPLGITSWSDKLLQEVIRMVLSAYYEPQFANSSHGFRPGRGCHTALWSIAHGWKGIKWYVEGDIQGCFDNINHSQLLAIISRSVKDDRLLKLLKGMLEAGYLEEWTYGMTYSGVPQGGVLSPLLSNIYMNELDTYVEQILIPRYTKGKRRRCNREYARLGAAKRKAKREGDLERYRTLKQQQQAIPSGWMDDPDYRRLQYCRYADDFLLGFAGPKHEAEEIKSEIGKFLQALGLTLSQEKTLVTHATTASARFLGYHAKAVINNSRRGNNGHRTLNGRTVLQVPQAVEQEWRSRYSQRGESRHRTNLSQRSDHDIVTAYAVELQGLVNYYQLAGNVAGRLYPVKYTMQQSLVKTLAHKHKRPVTWVYRKYKRKMKNGVTAIVVETPREGKRPLVAKFGAQPIRHDDRVIVNDQRAFIWPNRNELVKRLLANQCELCGSTADVQVHHLRKLKDIQQWYKGRPNPPTWVVRQMELHRKTLVVCGKCHREIHAGIYDGPKLK